MGALENSRFSLVVFTSLPKKNLIKLNERDLSTNLELYPFT